MPEIQERQVGSLGQEDPLEKGIRSSLLAWRVPWTEEPGGLWSTGLERVGTRLKRLSTSTVHMRKCCGDKQSRGGEQETLSKGLKGAEGSRAARRAKRQQAADGRKALGPVSARL